MRIEPMQENSTLQILSLNFDLAIDRHFFYVRIDAADVLLEQIIIRAIFQIQDRDRESCIEVDVI